MDLIPSPHQKRKLPGSHLSFERFEFGPLFLAPYHHAQKSKRTERDARQYLEGGQRTGDPKRNG